MQTTSNLPAIAVYGDLIPVIPNSQHEYVLPTAQVAQGYGVKDVTIRRHQQAHADELIEGKHWVVQNMNTLGGKQQMTLWTKRGVVRLGFFIRSKRAKVFRDRAEDLVVGENRKYEVGNVNEMDAARLDRLEEWFGKLDARVLNLMGRVDGPRDAALCKVADCGRFKQMVEWLPVHYERRSDSTVESHDIHRHYCEDHEEFATAIELNKAASWAFGLEKKKFRTTGSRIATGFVGLGRK